MPASGAARNTFAYVAAVLLIAIAASVVAAQRGRSAYQDLPAAAKTYAEEVRRSCKEAHPNGVPADPMAGITQVLLNSTPALILDNEGLCSDHYSGANCTNRGCDVVIMTAPADGASNEIFREHLYDRTFDIGGDSELKSISARVYAGGPYCGTPPDAVLMSSDSCAVEIRYDRGAWLWRKSGA